MFFTRALLMITWFKQTENATGQRNLGFIWIFCLNKFKVERNHLPGTSVHALYKLGNDQHASPRETHVYLRTSPDSKIEKIYKTLHDVRDLPVKLR